MKKTALTCLIIIMAVGCFSQEKDKTSAHRYSFETYQQLKELKAQDSAAQLTYNNPALKYKVDIPAWLNLRETGSPYVFGGTFPVIDSCENAVVVKAFPKEKFPSYEAFKDFVVEGQKFGHPFSWSNAHIFYGKTYLGKSGNIGDSYKVYLFLQQLLYDCKYVLAETPSAYLWIDFTATRQTYEKNLPKFEEFLSGFSTLKN